MKIGKSFDKSNLFDKTTDTTDDIAEGGSKFFYPVADADKVAHLPAGAIAYLEILEYDVNPATGEEGEVIRNTTDNKFYLWKTDAWIEVLFSMEEVVE